MRTNLDESHEIIKRSDLNAIERTLLNPYCHKSYHINESKFIQPWSSNANALQG